MQGVGLEATTAKTDPALSRAHPTVAVGPKIGKDCCAGTYANGPGPHAPLPRPPPTPTPPERARALLLAPRALVPPPRPPAPPIRAPPPGPAADTATAASRERVRDGHRHHRHHGHHGSRRDRRSHRDGRREPRQTGVLPPVPDRIKGRIRRGEFIELHVLLQANLTRPAREHKGRADDKSTQRTVAIADFQGWIEAWSIYAAVLSSYFSHLASRLFHYQHFMTLKSRSFQARAWLRYDSEFRLKLAANGSWHYTMW